MSYNEIINLIFLIISSITGILTIHFIIFAIIGLFAKKKYPKTDTKLKYGIIISARNEDKVIGNLIKSIQKNDYPQDKLQIFVVAHNCTDNTAKIARENGAEVFEYNNENEKTKGYALKYLFEQINNKYKNSFDGFIFLDADNILTENYISKLNDAFVYYNKERVITSYRNSKNFGTNVISALYGLLFIKNCRFECRGRTVCGCSTRVQGTGFLVNSKSLENGWKYVTLTEDWEFSADQILQGNKIAYCDEAMFYDEQPTTIKVMLRQRLRWCRGHWLVFLAKGKELFLSLFKSKKKTKHKFSAYDILINILPMGLIAFVLFILQIILLAFTPIFSTLYLEIWKNFIINFLTGLATSFAYEAIYAFIVFLSETKRIKGVDFGKKLGAILLWPIFNILSVPLTIIAVFKKVEWKAIPHTDTTNFEKLDKMQNGENNLTDNTNIYDEENQVPSEIK